LLALLVEKSPKPQAKVGGWFDLEQGPCGDVFVNVCVEEVEHHVVFGPDNVGLVGGDGAVNVAEKTRPTESNAHVDAPLRVVGGVKREDDMPTC
jgi:hypothetical protein